MRWCGCEGALRCTVRPLWLHKSLSALIQTPATACAERWALLLLLPLPLLQADSRSMDTDGVLRELLNGRVDTVEFSGKQGRKKLGEEASQEARRVDGTCWQKRARQGTCVQADGQAGGWVGREMWLL